MRNCEYGGTEDTEGQLYVIHGLSIVRRVGTPNPTLFKGQLYVCVCIYVHTHTHKYVYINIKYKYITI